MPHISRLNHAANAIHIFNPFISSIYLISTMTFQAKLTTKLEKFSSDSAVLELSNNVDREQLNQILKNLLKHLDKANDDDLKNKTFDFLIGGRILRLSVDKHLELYSEEIDAKEILSEKLVEVEYILALEPPEPLEAIPHEDWVSCVDANADYLISGSYDKSIRIFTVKDRKNLVTIEDAHEKPLTKVKWLGRLNSKVNELFFITCGHDEISILRKFNTKTLKVEDIQVYKGHNRSVNCVDTFENLIATGSFDKTLRIWSSDQGEQDVESNGVSQQSKKKQKVKSNSKHEVLKVKSALMTLTGHESSITGVKWLDGLHEFNCIATCSTDRTISFWDIEVGEKKRTLLAGKPLLGIDYNKENNLILAASCDRHVRLFDARGPDNSTASTVYTSHRNWVSSVAFGNSNNFISGGFDNLVKLWDIRSPKACLYDLIGHHGVVLDINWNNPSYVFSGSADSTLKVFATG